MFPGADTSGTPPPLKLCGMATISPLRLYTPRELPVKLTKEDDLHAMA